MEVAMDGTGNSSEPGVPAQTAQAAQTTGEEASAPAEPPVEATPAESDEPALPRGASGAELDSLRVSLRKVSRPGVRASPPAALVKVEPAGSPALESSRLLDQTIDEGRALLASDPAAAHALFEKVWLRNTNDARVMSHYGLTLVRVEGDRQRGIRFCEEAVRRFPRSSEFLINLARALVETRNKEHAVRALSKAQSLDPSDPQVREAFEALGLRRRPVIWFLPRNFILNRWLGRLTWRMRHAAP
jgi:hypothetical protein